MRIFSTATILACVALLATTATFAGAELVTLPGGESVPLMHPGVDGVSHPRTLHSTMLAPVYPERARSLATDSTVTVAVLVQADGTAAVAEVVEAQHPGLGFEKAAIDAVSGWRFKPARRDGRAVNSYTFIRLKFRQPERSFDVATSLGTGIIHTAGMSWRVPQTSAGGSGSVGAHRPGVTAVPLPPAGTAGTLYRPGDIGLPRAIKKKSGGN